MTTRFAPTCAASAIALMTALCGPAVPAASAQAPKDVALLPPVPVRVEVVLTRYQGEKKISSLPFTLLASARDERTSSSETSIRMGVDVPVGTATTTSGESRPAGNVTRTTESTSTRVEYRSVGTNIDCSAKRVDESRYSVYVVVSDSSIYSPDGDAGKNVRAADAAAFRTFRTGNTVVMRDGQTALFGAGTDKISGETLKVEVTLRVEK